MKFDLGLYLVTDSTGLSETDFLNRVDLALTGGATIVQLREKERSGAEFYALAQKVKELCDKHGVLLIIDDRIDIALACDCAGVHVGSQDIPVEAARRLMGKDRIVGATAKTVEAALKAKEQGADYLGVGAIFPTTTKVITVRTEVSVLNDIKDATGLPIVAIGGLNKDNCAILEGSKADGIAAVSAIMKADDPKQAAAELLECSRRMFGEIE